MGYCSCSGAGICPYCWDDPEPDIDGPACSKCDGWGRVKDPWDKGPSSISCQSCEGTGVEHVECDWCSKKVRKDKAISYLEYLLCSAECLEFNKKEEES